MRLRRRVWAASVVLAMGVVGSATGARADGPYEGEWRTGPMRIEVSVESWGGDCGPRPQSTTVSGGSTVRVTQSGDDLTFQGRPARTTRGCWSENTAVRRVSSSYQSGTWRIVCRTPDDDPRAETGQYTLRAASADRIEFRDVSRYDWQLNTSQCRATITSTQTFERISGPTPAPTPTPTPVEEPAEIACTPGAPARIALRPNEAVLEPGGRTCFSVRVVDASGCTVRGRSPQLELRAPEGVTGRLRGNCFEAAASAAEGEGEFTIVAREGSLEARARVQVRTPDLSDLIARRAEGGGAIALGEGESTSEEAARLAARSEGGARGAPVWLVVGAGVGLFLVIAASVGLALVGRRRKKKTSRSLEDELSPAALAPPPPAAAAAPAAPPQVDDGEPKICPTCRRGHPSAATHCSVDGTPLVSYADFAAGNVASGGPSERTCPTCGTRYPATTRFCGKDGTTLG